MARIAGITMEHADQEVQLAIGYARAGIAQLTGRETDRMVEPLEVLALEPGLLRAYGAVQQATAELDQLPERIRMLVHLKAATVAHCEYCIDLGSQASRQGGLSDEQLLALPTYRTSDYFSEDEKLTMDYAVGMTRTPVDVSDELFDRLKERFSDRQLVELTHVIALENLYARFNLGLGVGSAGFSDGMVCAVPAS